MAEILNVNLGERSYPIRFGVDLSAEVGAEAARLAAAGRKIAVLTDRHVAREQTATLRAMSMVTTQSSVPGQLKPASELRQPVRMELGPATACRVTDPFCAKG